MKETLTTIRENLDEQVGKEVTLTAYEARNVVIEHTGILLNTYPSVFVIDLEDTPNRVSYNYSDILTGYVELNFN